MKVNRASIAVGLVLATGLLPAASQEAGTRPASLRQPGFLFLELTVTNVAEHVEFFETVAGYKAFDQETNWVWLRTERGDLMLSGGGGAPNQGQPPGTRRLPGVEVGIVVENLDKAFEAAGTFKDKGFNIVDRIARRPWGPRDFRLLTPNGYYLRVTEPM